jgi:hypothetical protein
MKIWILRLKVIRETRIEGIGIIPKWDRIAKTTLQIS